MASSDDPIRRQLHASLIAMEQDALEQRLNIPCLHSLEEAALLLDCPALSRRVQEMWADYRAVADLARTVTHVPPTSGPFSGYFTVRSREDLESKYPPFNQSVVLDRIKSWSRSNRHLRLCLEGRTQDALNAARSSGYWAILRNAFWKLGDLKREEIADALAVVGEFTAALQIARSSKCPKFRKQGIFMIVAIELFRRQRVAESEAILAELESLGLDPWDRIHLALGLAGRQPWGDYPFPDW